MPNNETWEKRFDSEFGDWLKTSASMAIIHGHPQFKGKRYIKDFIREQLTLARRKRDEEWTKAIEWHLSDFSDRENIFKKMGVSPTSITRNEDEHA